MTPKGYQIQWDTITYVARRWTKHPHSKLMREAASQEVDGPGFQKRMDKWIDHVYPMRLFFPQNVKVLDTAFGKVNYAEFTSE